MVSIATEVLRGEMATVASSASAPQGAVEDSFAQSLLESSVNSISKPATDLADAGKDAVAVADLEAPTKDAKVDRNVSVPPGKYLEIDLGPEEGKGSSKLTGQNNAEAVKGGHTVKNVAEGKTSAANSSEIATGKASERKKPGVSETSKAEASGIDKLEASETVKLEAVETKKQVPELNELETFESKKQDPSQDVCEPRKHDAHQAKKPEASRTIRSEAGKTVNGAADESQVNDTVSMQGLISQSGTDAPVNPLQILEVQPTISNAGPNDKRRNESVQPALPAVVTIAQRDTKGSSAAADRPTKLSVSTSDATSDLAARIEQTKNGAVVVTSDSTPNGPAATGKASAGVGAVTAALHGEARLLGQNESPLTARGNEAVMDTSSAMQQRFGPETTTSSNSHNPTHSDQHGMTGESRPGLLAATATSLEVGITNGTNGWLKIRAEMEGGLVTASLSSGSVAGQEVLHRELPSLAAFLQEEKIGVSTLVVKQTQMADMNGASYEGSMQRQEQPSPRHNSNSEGSRLEAGIESRGGGSEQETMYESWSGFGSSGGIFPVVAGGNGSWLNVRV